jgi:membrane protein
VSDPNTRHRHLVDWLRYRLLKPAAGRQWVRKLKTFSLPGFEGIPVWDVMLFFWLESRRDRLTVRASSMAFSFLLATFPGLLFFFTLVPYIPIPGLDQAVLSTLSTLMPEEALAFIELSIQDIFDRQRPELLSLGVFMSFFFATNGVNSMIDAFNKQHPSYIKRSFWQLRGVSIQITVLIFLLFLGSLLLIIGGREALQWLEQRSPLDNKLQWQLLAVFRWLVIVMLYFGSISLIYYFGPARKKRWKFITPGSTLATLLSIVATLGFAFFVSRFGVYNQVYGSLAALIVFMIWMNINTFVILVGFELNNSILMNRHQRQHIIAEPG